MWFSLKTANLLDFIMSERFYHELIIIGGKKNDFLTTTFVLTHNFNAVRVYLIYYKSTNF